MPKKFTLGKNQRLKSRKQIDRLFREGRSFSVFPFRITYIFDPILPTAALPLQAGFGVSTRNFKKAADRNRIKRLTREAYRLQHLPLAQSISDGKKSLSVFFIYIGKELPEYPDLSQKVGVILQKLIKLTPP